jgi:hypothetical protein
MNINMMFLQRLMKVNKEKNNFLTVIILFFLLDQNNDAYRTRLMDKKQQQWKQENCIF